MWYIDHTMTKDAFDFQYAVQHTVVLRMPARPLETFGATVVDYHLVCEVMDRVDQVRIREGRLHAERPEVLTPAAYADSILEGFSGEQAEKYVEWMKEHQQDLLILRYGFRIRKDTAREEVVTDRLDAVLDRIESDLRKRDSPLSALLRGVDEPWEVCLVKLAADLVQRSAGHHQQILRNDPHGYHHEIEQAFAGVARDRSQLGDLAHLLRQRGLFEQYEDRFFDLVSRRA